VWGKPFSYGSSAIDSAQAFVNRYADLFRAWRKHACAEVASKM
jgi:hypothetical protein